MMRAPRFQFVLAGAPCSLVVQLLPTHASIGDRGAAYSAALATTLLMLLAAATAGTSPSPSRAALFVAGASFAWAGLVITSAALAPREALRLALGCALVAGLGLLFAPPLLSDDVFRYLWDGRVSLAGVSPYRYAPDDPHLAPLRDALWRRVNNADIPTIYPPAAQLLFALCNAIAHTPLPLKALMLAAHLGTVPLVAAIAPTPTKSRATLVYALCPLALTESALSGHVDAVAGLAIAAALLALLRSRAFVAALFVAFASATKLVGLALAPLLALRDRRAALLAIVLSLAPLIALAGAGGNDTTGGLGHYARRWRGNEGAFVVVEAAAGVFVDRLASANDAPTHIRFPALRGLIRALAGTPIDPRAGLNGPKKTVSDPADFQRIYIAGLLARALVLASLVGLVFWLLRAQVAPLTAARWVLLMALLFAPQMHPWYLLWLLPLECAAGGLAGLVWAASAFTAYAPSDRWLVERIWSEPSGARVAVHGLVWLVLSAEVWAAFRSRPRKVPAGAS